MSYADATYQMGRCAALAKAMEIGNPLILRKACTDTVSYTHLDVYKRQSLRSLDWR